MQIAVEPNDIYMLLVAAVLGGLIGLEREFHEKPAGLRTNILIAVGSALFTMLSSKLAGDVADQTRIAAQIVTGVGFLGAGVILRDRLTITGITTAATIWVVASVGMGVGAGFVGVAAVATAIILVVLFILDRLEKWIDHIRGAQRYTIIFTTAVQAIEEIEAIVGAADLKIRWRRSHKEGTKTVLEILVLGRWKAHEEASRKLIASERLESVAVG